MRSQHSATSTQPTADRRPLITVGTRMILLLLLGLALLAASHPTYAADNSTTPLPAVPASTSAEGLIPVACASGKDAAACNLCVLLKTITNIGNSAFGLAGALALFFFVVGGVMWVFSAGNKTMVENGKATLQAALVGLIIVLIAWQLVAIIITILLGNKPGDANIFGGAWYNFTCTYTPASPITGPTLN